MEKESGEFRRPPAKLLKEIVLYVPSILAPALVGIATLAILTRLLQPAIYGDYLLALAVVTTVSSVLGEWLVPTVIRFHPEWMSDQDSRKVLLGAVSRLAVVASLASGAVIFVLIWVVTDLRFALAGSVLGIVSVFLKPAFAFLRAEFRTARYSWMYIVNSVLTPTFGIAGFLLTDEPVALLWGSTFASFLVMLWLPTGGIRVLRTFGTNAASRLSRDLLRFGVPVSLTSIGGQLLLLGDRYLLALIAGPAAVGLYGPNYAIGERLTSMTFAPLFSAGYPLTTSQWARGDLAGATSSLRNIQRLYLVVGGYLASLALAFHEDIASLLLAPEYRSASYIVGLVAIGNVVWYLGILSHQPLELAKKTGIITRLVATCAAVNITLNIILIPIYGISGAAAATVVAYCMYLVAARYASKRSAPVVVPLNWALIGIVVVFATGLTSLTWFVDAYRVVWLTLSPLVFLGLLFLTRVVAIEDFRNVARSLKAPTQTSAKR